MEEEKIIITNPCPDMLFPDLENIISGYPKYSPKTIVNYNFLTDKIYLEDKIYEEYGVYKYKKILKFTSTNMEIVKILRDCYDNDVYISLDKNKMLVINKDNMWEYIKIIKDFSSIDDKGKEIPDTKKRFYDVDIIPNKASNEKWDYLEGLRKKMTKPKIWEDFSELKQDYENKKKWEKLNEHFITTHKNTTGKYFPLYKK